MMDEEFVSKVQVGADATSLEFLQACYRSPHLPLSTRMRAAIAALQYEHPKLGVQMNLHDDGTWAERLEKAIERSANTYNPKAINGNGERAKLIEAKPVEGSTRGLRRI